MLTKIKQRIMAWKRLFARGCKNADEHSSWREILMEQEYYNSCRFYTSGQQKLLTAVKTIGIFSPEEQKFLETLPAYAAIRSSLQYDSDRKNFTDIIDGAEIFSICSAKNDDIPLREYIIITDREDLQDLEIYIFRASHNCKCGRHGIIRYTKELPADCTDPEYADDDIPF